MMTSTALTAASAAHHLATTLTAQAQARALRAIEDVHLSYYEKGGIRDTVEHLESQARSAGQHIYALAVYASKQTETVDEAADLFRQLCTFAEAAYKEQHEVENLRTALPTWATYKSNILRGMERFDLDPINYRSERQFRIASEDRAEKADRPRRREGPQLASPDEIGEFLQTTAVRNSLVRPVADLVFHVEAVAHGKTQEALSILKATLTKLEPLVDPDKIN